MKRRSIVVTGLMAAVAIAAMAGELLVRNVNTGAYGEYQHTGGGVLLLKAVQSSATGGVLRVKQDYMIGGAGVTVREVGSPATVTVSRVVSDLPSDVYLMTGQKITLTNSAEIAAHTVYLFFEKQD